MIPAGKSAETRQTVELATVNSSLKLRGVRGRVVAHDDRLYWRTTVTAADGTRKDRRVRLDLPANPSQLLLAESRVLSLAAEVQSNGCLPPALPWDRPEVEVAAGVPTLLVSDAIELFKQDFWQGRLRTSAAERSLRNYLRVLKPLPPNANLTIDLLCEVAKNMAPGTRSRLARCQLFKRVAVLVGLPGVERLDALRTPYEPSPRQLPSDEQIVEIVERMRSTKYAWLTAVLATYGCRPSEAFSLFPADDGTAKVLTIKRKSKLPVWRTALALQPAWVDQFRLHEIDRPWEVATPTQYDSFEAERLSSNWGKSVARLFPHPIYDLRHAWAVRSIRRGINASLAAKCMGHSLAVHHSTYHRWLEQSDVAAVAAGLRVS